MFSFTINKHVWRRMKTIISGLMAAVLSTGMTLTAFAGSWGKNDTGWFYLKDNGQYATNEWDTINGKYYYFDGNGYMLSDTITPDGYTVNADGSLNIWYDWKVSVRIY